LHFEPLDIAGAFRVTLQPYADERGFFSRTYCTREFVEHGLPGELVQANLSYNRKRGTVRGMHYQKPPSREAKLVRCVRGGILDVIIDLRTNSPTFMRHAGATLTAQNHAALFIPWGVAHGFQTLEDDTEVEYLMTDYYAPELAAGVRWNDPVFGIEWPLAEVVIHPRDAGYPDFDPRQLEAGVRDRA
jgi:dTDP-4-dehydrorhamnose 3,5-epimerase